MADPLPTFSIIVATRARPAQLADCLRSLAALAYSRDEFEVIVVDDGSPTTMDNVVTAVRGLMTVILLRTSHAGPAAARNAGARAARGRFVAFTDDDCRVASDWLKGLNARLCHTPDRMVGGSVINKLVDNNYAVTSQIILDAVYAHYNSDPEDASFFASNNMAMSAELFHKLGGFDEGFPRAAAEDRDICNRWRHAGHKMTYAPDSVVYHSHEMTMPGFCRQHFNYGRGAWQYHARRAQRGSGRISNDLSFHAHLPRLLRRPLSELQPRQKIAVAGLLAVWQVANAAGFFCQALGVSRQTRPRHRGSVQAELQPPRR
jgi:GT2 family glycosyltransferase